MWELIRANQRKSFFLFIIMGVVLILLGFLIGSYVNPRDGGLYGILLAFGIWGILSLISMTSGNAILLALSKAKEVKPEVHPQLFNIVEEMKIAAGLPAMPKVYIINEEAPNAFATGYNPKNSAIAVTSGLLARMNRDELQGVVAHETAHIMNRDVKFMTHAGIMLGTIVLISQIFLRTMFYSSGSRRYSSDSKGGGQMQLILLIVAIVFAILAPIAAQLLYFAISRKREYLADATGARLTRYPEGLASALEKLSQNTAELPVANKVTAGMYIVNPLKKEKMKMSDLSSTHPPISERIRILRSMAGGAGYLDYQNAYNSVKGSHSTILPPSALKEQDNVEIRKPGETITQANARQQKRILGDLMMTVSNFAFITCTCGLKIKMPPEFNKDEIICPKCGTKNKTVHN